MLKLWTFGYLILLSYLVISPLSAQQPPVIPIQPVPTAPSYGGEGHNPLQSCTPPDDSTVYQQRLDLYEKAIEESPQSSELHFQAARMLARLQRWDDSQKNFFQALNYNKDGSLSAKIYHELGNLYACQQQFDKAIDQYRSSLQLNPQDSDSKYNLALTQLLAKQQEQQQQQQQQENDGESQEESDEKQEGEQQNQNTAQENLENQQQQQTASSEDNSIEPQNSQEQEASQEEQASNSEENSAEESEDAMAQTGESEEEGDEDAMSQVVLTKEQVEQLLNMVQENRTNYIQRLLQRQQPPPPTEKNW